MYLPPCPLDSRSSRTPDARSIMSGKTYQLPGLPLPYRCDGGVAAALKRSTLRSTPDGSASPDLISPYQRRPSLVSVIFPRLIYAKCLRYRRRSPS